MRCPSCGTDNEPDSRFCGGCGARMPGAAKPNLAPTAKIADDTPYPPPSAVAPPLARGPVSHGPASIPPPAMPTPPPGQLVYGSVAPRPKSIPPQQRQPSTGERDMPGTSQRPKVAQRPAAMAQASTASGSFAIPPRRPVGLIAVVLIADLGLAAAGAVLLGKGLASKEDKKSTSSPAPAPAKPEQKTEAPAAAPPANAPAPKGTADAVSSAGSSSSARAAAPTTQGSAGTGAPDKGSAAARKDRKEDRKEPAKPPTKTSGTATGPVTEPEDSVFEPAPSTKPTEAQIDKVVNPAKAKCLAEAGPVRGTIEIVFRVMADGSIANAAVVQNTTGNAELGGCLISSIGALRVSAHGGPAINFVRTLIYP